MRDYLFVINCRLRKKRKTVPKFPFLTRKPPFLGPFFQKKKRKTVPHTNPNFLRKQAFRHRQVQLFEIIEASALNKPQSPPPAYKNNLILSEQSERFNFSPQATHPASNAIVLCALIKAKHHNNFSAQRDPTVVQVVSALCPLFDNSRAIHDNLRKYPKHNCL